MATLRVGIRDFRENLASYILKGDSPIAITRNGDTVGYFIPTRRKRTQAEREAFWEAAKKMDAMLAEMGVTEDELIEDFKLLRKADRK